MNELEFKRHLKALVHGHHHPEEHDWAAPASSPKKRAGSKARTAKSRASKTTKRK